MALVKGRQCSRTGLELLALETVHYYARQDRVPAAAALEAIGFRVGRQLAERYTANRPRLGESLDVIKFVCKEFWADVFYKQIDNLRTNHRGTFVLKDAAFQWLVHLSPDPAAAIAPNLAAAPNGAAPGVPDAGAAGELARDYLRLPCALVRGALSHLGVECAVTADASNLPTCDFTVVLRGGPG